MSDVAFVTCDLLDDYPEKIFKWLRRQWMVNLLKVTAHVKVLLVKW